MNSINTHMLQYGAPTKKRDALVSDIEELVYERRTKRVRKHSFDQKKIIFTPCTNGAPLPDSVGDEDPDDYLQRLIQHRFPGLKLGIKTASELNDYFEAPSEEQMAGYTIRVVDLVRSNNVAGLREYNESRLDCFNRFGEGLLSSACRRGFQEIVDYLMNEKELSVRVRDDSGRTPLHDACWHPQAQLEICKWLLRKDPSLFLVADRRGFTPFQYARNSDWLVWRQLLYSNREALDGLTANDVLYTFQENA